MKKIFVAFLALLFVVTACQNKIESNQNQEVAEVSVEEVVDLDLANFEAQAETLIGRQVVLNGMIDHVCKHGGQKMFMVNENADARVKITTGENMAAFNTELEGETVKVIGIIDEQRIDEDYLREWEEEILAEKIEGEHSEHGEKVHMGEHAAGDEAEEEPENPEMKQINDYRKMIQESGKEYISFFSVTCVDYEVVRSGSEDGV